MTTASPGLTCSTPSPTASTTPAPSCPSKHGQGMVVAGAHNVEIGVTDAGRLDSHRRLAGTRLVQIDLLDRVAVEVAQDDAAIHDESRSRARVPPMSASVRSVSARRCWMTASTPSWPPAASP